ncbi:MAG: DUF61 family protein [Desulfurococcales archaeon]|nr:DUF61 family protein [Desulfurococcales archaeon]
MPKGLEKKVIAAYRRDASRLRQLLPDEYLTLEDLYQGARRIRLASGEIHELDPGEVERLLSEVPPYFWRLIKVPVVLRYTRYSDGSRRYVVSGDQWQKRLIEILLTGDYSSTGMEELDIQSFTRLLARYKTIIFVTITL